METHRLVRMANDIAAFFQSEPDRQVALEGVASHIKRFWDPRMRRELLLWLDEHGGDGLQELALASIRTHREMLQPAAPGGHS